MASPNKRKHVAPEVDEERALSLRKGAAALLREVVWAAQQRSARTGTGHPPVPGRTWKRPASQSRRTAPGCGFDVEMSPGDATAALLDEVGSQQPTSAQLERARKILQRQPGRGRPLKVIVKLRALVTGWEKSQKRQSRPETVGDSFYLRLVPPSVCPFFSLALTSTPVARTPSRSL